LNYIALSALIPFFIVAILDISLLARYIQSSETRTDDNADDHPVSVVVAAYNAERTIAGTLRSILSSGLPEGSEVIVVDDGSTDMTIRRSREVEGDNILIVHQGHMGKFYALNEGISLSRHERIVTVDADTTVEYGAIGRIASGLENCDAVAGNLFVKDSGPLIVKAQAQEHIRISMYRRAEGAVTTISGPFAAFKRELLLNHPFIDSQVEDFEHTVRIRRRGAKICYEPHARARTEMPSNFMDYINQRKRWASGTLEEMKKKEIPLSVLIKGYIVSLLDISVVPLSFVLWRFEPILVLFIIEAVVQTYGAYKEDAVVGLGNVLFLPVLIFLAFMHISFSINAHLNILHHHNNV